MAIIKCKMCGGDLNLVEGASTAECQFCGSVQTVPKVDDEKKLQQFERADWLRRNCEFDKAAAVYEAIVSEFRQESEAYWGLVLCKYGIEYVDDPATGKKIPTCHRSSYDSVLDDGNLEQALDYADVVARKVYRDEAKHLEKIREGILEVSANEKPYDIFICYKETDSNGNRTLDSVLAQDLYTALTDRGYRVFFSRITLQSKLGEAYEPYIFSALNSAKVMLAIGTDPEYYNAVWVKNEWSRYLKICAADKAKHLIPCYRNLDAYDMPKEFRPLQGVDLGKMGAVQDILFNMEKYIPLKKKNTTVIQEKVVVGGSGNNKIVSLLDRGNMALEDGDWAKADSFFEDVLNNDSKNAQAYLGKTLAQEKCRTIDAFVRKRKDASQAVREQILQLKPDLTHIDEAVEKYTLTDYVYPVDIRELYQFDLSYPSAVVQRQQQYREEESYWQNHKLLSKAEKFAVGEVAVNLQREKQALFSFLAERTKKAAAAEAAVKQALAQRYQAHLQECDKKAAELLAQGMAFLEQDYQRLLQTAKDSTDVEELTKTAEKFERLGDYQDSMNLAEHCRKRADEEQAKLDAETERQRLIKLRQEKERKAKAKRLKVIVAIAACLILAFIVIINTVIIPESKYNKALELMAAEAYPEAIAAFVELGDYKDSVQKIAECEIGILDDKYDAALALMKEGKYNEAIKVFNALAGHKDSVKKIEECNAAILEAKYEASYQNAVALMDAKQYLEAIAAFEALNGYKDSAKKIEACETAIYEEKYQAAVALMESKQYLEAIAAFEALNGYKDSAEKVAACETAIYEEKYQAAVALMESKQYLEAIVAFEALNGYKDSAEKIAACETAIYEEKYQNAIALMGTKKYTEAIAAFEALNGYKDSANKIVDCQNAIQQQYEEKFEGQYNSAKSLMNQGKTAQAAIAFGKLGDYKDSRSLSKSLWDKLTVQKTIAGEYDTFGITTDGTIIAAGRNKEQSNVGSWRNITCISASDCHTVGLHEDGTVVAVYDPQWGNAYGQCEVSDWKDIVAISAGVWHTVGLKADGTVIAIGNNEAGQCNVSGWTDIVAIGAGSGNTVGLKSDGTVVAVGKNLAGQCNVSGWKDIVAISVGSNHTVGLKVDGTVVATGMNDDGQCNVGSWKDIVDIATGMSHTVGLKADGTLVAIGWNAYGQCNVSGWTGIISISAGGSHNIGLKADGTVVANGNNSYGQCNVNGFANIKLPN